MTFYNFLHACTKVSALRENKIQTQPQKGNQKMGFFKSPGIPKWKIPPPSQADPSACFFSRKMPQNGLPAAAAPTEPKDRGVKSGSFGPKRLENDGSSRRGLKFPKKRSPKIRDFLESGWGWIPPPFCYWCLLGTPPPGSELPLFSA